MNKKTIVGSYVILVVALAFSVFYGIGKTTEIDGAKVTYKELSEKIKEKENELDDITRDLNKNKKHYDKLQEIDEEYEELLSAVTDYQVEVTTLESDIESKEKELKKLDGEIAKVIDEPMKVNPGTFYFGDDIEEGRYKVTNQEGQRGNIYFRGGESFAETFGKGEYAVEEYTFNAYEGEEIQFDIPALLYPVE